MASVAGDARAATANVALLRRFYLAFAARDGDGMASCYSPVAMFSDPVYPSLRGAEVGDMWRMLTARAQELAVDVEALVADEGSAQATWTARYLFGAQRRPVANRVRSSFELADGLVVRQRDEFDLHAWAAQALGTGGRLLGWTPWARDRIRRTAAEQLAAFRAARAAGPS